MGLGSDGSGKAFTSSDGGYGAGPEDSGYSAMSLERAVGLLSLPRVVCECYPGTAEDGSDRGGPIVVGIGRFGVYVKHNEMFKSVPSGIDVLGVGEEMAIGLIDELVQVSEVAHINFESSMT